MKKKMLYRCSNCGFESIKWLGKCPTCNSWNTLQEEIVDIKKNVSAKINSGSQIRKLNDIISSKEDRIITGINEFDRVMGGGIVKDSITIITARPGAGKSTLLLEISNEMK